MIHYQLRCGAGHEFDGWFKDSANFDRQVSRALVACPNCAGTDVTRALMAPALRKKGAPAKEASAKEAARGSGEIAVKPEAASPGQAVAGALPDAVRGALQKLRAEIERNCDYVGPNFAQEARRIHNGEAPARGIYGEASDAEAEGLGEDGIDVARIPWLPRAEG